MKPLDKAYLSLQFKNAIHTKNGLEFQALFENIMEKVYSDFIRVRPYGDAGDGGNDGFRKDAGVYYQVYAPKTPQISHVEAAKKYKEDFVKLTMHWNQIGKIREFKLVFNDKYFGSSIIIETAISELEQANPGIIQCISSKGS